MKQRGISVKLPQMADQDFNQVEALDRGENDGWHIIFLLEGVLIYSSIGVPTSC